jgi:hypothetical protein
VGGEKEELGDVGGTLCRQHLQTSRRMGLDPSNRDVPIINTTDSLNFGKNESGIIAPGFLYLAYF